MAAQDTQDPDELVGPGIGDDDFDPAGEEEEFVSLSSVKGRLKAAREAAEQDRSRKFAMPWTGGSMMIELRPVGQREQDRIAKRNERAPEAFRELYTAADVLIKATVGFHVVIDPDTGRTGRVAPGEDDWLSVAHGLYEKLGDVTIRQAVLRVLNTEENPAPALRLLVDYREWLETQGESLLPELERGFAGTP